MTPQTPEPGQVTVVVNPERRDAADILVEQLREAGCSVEMICPESADDLPDAMAGAASSDASVVAAVGGDGTQRSAAVALDGTPKTLVVVPGGTVNLLGQILGIESPDDSGRAIIHGGTRVVDLGVANGQVFVLNASSGFDAAVIQAVDEDDKRLGRFAFAKETVRLLRRHRPLRVEVTVDGDRLFSGRAMGVLVANFGQRGSSRLDLVPDARPDDGRLDVMIQRCDDIRSILRAAVAIVRGHRPRSDDVLLAQGATIDVVWHSPVWGQRDGDDVGKDTTFHYSVRADALILGTLPAER